MVSLHEENDRPDFVTLRLLNEINRLDSASSVFKKVWTRNVHDKLITRRLLTYSTQDGEEILRRLYCEKTVPCRRVLILNIRDKKF